MYIVNQNHGTEKETKRGYSLVASTPLLPQTSNFTHIAANGPFKVISNSNAIFIFNENEYIVDRHSTSIAVDDIAVDSKGNVFYAADDKIRCIQYKETPETYIGLKEVKLGSDLVKEDKIEVEGNQRLEFSFAYSSLLKSANHNLYYILDGVDNEWKPFTRSNISYQLKPGSYRLIIKDTAASSASVLSLTSSGN